MPDLAAVRRRMADRIARRGIRDARVLDALKTIPREAFVESGDQLVAYEDRPLPIAERQTISQPFIVALMLEAAELEPESRVLEIGAGSGYAAALIGHIAREVHTVERFETLALLARDRLAALGRPMWSPISAMARKVGPKPPLSMPSSSRLPPKPCRRP